MHIEIGHAPLTISCACEIPIGQRTMRARHLDSDMAVLSIVVQEGFGASSGLLEWLLAAGSETGYQLYCIGGAGTIGGPPDRVVWRDEDGFACVSTRSLADKMVGDMSPEKVVAWPADRDIRESEVREAISRSRRMLRLSTGREEDAVIGVVGKTGACGVFVPGENWFEVWGGERGVADILVRLCGVIR